MQHINQYMAERNQLMAAQLFQQQVEVVAERDRTIAELEAKLAAFEEVSESIAEEVPANG